MSLELAPPLGLSPAGLIETLLKFFLLKCQQNSLAKKKMHPGNINTPTSIAYKLKNLRPPKQPTINYLAPFFPLHPPPWNKEKLWKVRERNTACTLNSPEEGEANRTRNYRVRSVIWGREGKLFSLKQELKIPLPHVILQIQGLFRQYYDQTAFDTYFPPAIKHSLIFKYQAAASRFV